MLSVLLSSSLNPALSSGEMTPLGTPVLTDRRATSRRRPKRPRSLITGLSDRLGEVQETSPKTTQLTLSPASFGLAASALATLALFAIPGLDGDAQLAMLLLGAISGLFYLTLQIAHGSQRGTTLDWAATLFEASIPTALVCILAIYGLQAPLGVLIPVFALTLLVCASRLSASSVLFAALFSASCMPAAMIALHDVPFGELIPAMAWLALLGSAIAGATHYAALYVAKVESTESHAQRLQQELRRYLSPEVADTILRDGTQSKPERRTVTVLFCDLRGFTFLCERERPEDVVDLLNTLYAGTCRIIRAHGGNVNKFLGDGLLAIFGAPEDHPEHAHAAANAAIEIQQLIHFLRERGGIWTHVAMGIGIDTGAVVAGPIGGDDRLEYTVIGSSVNRAARLQALAEKDRHRIVLSAATRDALPEGTPLRSLGAVELKGFSRAEKIYTLNQD